MRVKLFTFRYSATLGGFDDRPLSHFIRDKEVLAFREYFFCVNDVPHLVCILTWQDAAILVADEEGAVERQGAPDPSRQPIVPPASGDRRPCKRKSAPDPTEGLDERQRTLFNTLREWRAEQAREDGVPPYLVFTNRHLVELVTALPDSLTALSNLHGVGAGKVKRYGEKVLRMLGTTTPDDAEAGVRRGEAVEVTT